MYPSLAVNMMHGSNSAFSAVNSSVKSNTPGSNIGISGHPSGFAPIGMPSINLNLNANKPGKKSDEATSNKRMPAKMGINYKFKGDGNASDDDDDEEDPDLALFNNDNKMQKKQSVRAHQSPNYAKDASRKDSIKEESKDTTIEFTKDCPRHLLQTPKSAAQNVKMKSMEEAKKDIDDKSKASGIKIESFTLPGVANAQKPTTPQTNDAAPAPKESLIKFEGFEGAGLKRAKKEKGDVGEDLSEVSLSEEDIETQDNLFGQYVKVNRTKQKYR